MGSKEGKSWRVHWADLMNGFWRGLKWMPFSLFLGGAGAVAVGGCDAFAVMVAVAAGVSMGVVVVVVVAMLRARHGCCCCCCWTRCERRKPLNSCFAGADVLAEAMLVRRRGVGVVQMFQFVAARISSRGSGSGVGSSSSPAKRTSARRRIDAGRERTLAAVSLAHTLT